MEIWQRESEREAEEALGLQDLLLVIAFVRARKPLPRRDKWIGERIQARIKHNNWCNSNNSRSPAPSIFDTKRFEIKIWQINLFKELLDPTTISTVTRRPIKVKSRNESNTVRLTSIAFLPPFFLSSYPPISMEEESNCQGWWPRMFTYPPSKKKPYPARTERSSRLLHLLPPPPLSLLCRYVFKRIFIHTKPNRREERRFQP